MLHCLNDMGAFLKQFTSRGKKERKIFENQVFGFAFSLTHFSRNPEIYVYSSSIHAKIIQAKNTKQLYLDYRYQIYNYVNLRNLMLFIGFPKILGNFKCPLFFLVLMLTIYLLLVQLALQLSSSHQKRFYTRGPLRSRRIPRLAKVPAFYRYWLRFLKLEKGKLHRREGM